MRTSCKRKMKIHPFTLNLSGAIERRKDRIIASYFQLRHLTCFHGVRKNIYCLRWALSWRKNASFHRVNWNRCICTHIVFRHLWLHLAVCEQRSACSLYRRNNNISFGIIWFLLFILAESNHRLSLQHYRNISFSQDYEMSLDVLPIPGALQIFRLKTFRTVNDFNWHIYVNRHVFKLLH